MATQKLVSANKEFAIRTSAETRTPFSTPRLDAEVLLSHVLSCRREDLIIRSKEGLPEKSRRDFLGLIDRRLLGEPIAYIVGHKEFYALDFKVAPGVLIPRPDTELLVERAVEFANSLSRTSGRQTGEIGGRSISGLKIAEFGVGSGCVLISILNSLPDALGVAVEKSPIALSIAKENAARIGVSSRIVFIESTVEDWIQHRAESSIDVSEGVQIESGPEFYKRLAGEFDIVVANPPYIDLNDLEVEENVRRWEPSEALFAANEGFEFIQSWADAAFRSLRSDGRAFFEIGQNQSQQTIEIFKKVGFSKIEKFNDLQGIARVVAGSV